MPTLSGEDKVAEFSLKPLVVSHDARTEHHNTLYLIL